MIHTHKDTVARGTAGIFISTACETELIRVLGYALSGRTLDAAAQATALAQCRTIARDVQDCAEPHDIAALPRCEDPDDQMFLELAPQFERASGDYLIGLFQHMGITDDERIAILGETAAKLLSI